MLQSTERNIFVATQSYNEKSHTWGINEVWAYLDKDCQTITNAGITAAFSFLYSESCKQLPKSNWTFYLSNSNNSFCTRLNRVLPYLYLALIIMIKSLQLLQSHPNAIWVTTVYFTGLQIFMKSYSTPN